MSAVLHDLEAPDPAVYQQCCGSPGGSELPMACPHILASPLHMALISHPAFPLPAMGLVHVSNRILQHRPIQTGERLTVHCTTGEQRPVRQGLELDVDTRMESQGQTVWESTSTVLSRGVKGTGGPRPQQPLPLTTSLRRSTCWRLPADLGRRYSRVSGDFNPIHFTAWTARLFGFKQAIIHGMWTLARALSELDADLPREGVEAVVEFRRPVFLPSRPTFLSTHTDQGSQFQLLDPRRGKVLVQGRVHPAS
jgi:acyl dehydratase